MLIYILLVLFLVNPQEFLEAGFGNELAFHVDFSRGLFFFLIGFIGRLGGFGGFVVLILIFTFIVLVVFRPSKARKSRQFFLDPYVLDLVPCDCACRTY